MTILQYPCKLRLPSAGFLPVLVTLLMYHSSLLSDSPSSSSSSSCSSSSTCTSSPLPPSAEHLLAGPSSSSSARASWLASWLQASPPHQHSGQGERRRRASGGAEGSSMCVMNSEQRRLTEMLNELQTTEELDPGRLALQQIWMRDNHNLTGVCPTFRPGGYPSLPGLEQQSMCPWTLEQNYRTDRFPRLLWFARCMCGHCQASEYTGSGNLYTCVPLYHRVAVIREVCQDGQLHFRWGRESVPVGCVCAHPTARQVP
ncbi:uncharacterized protein LOC143274785 [Babylonia areolata]|uniref:uncharacterized protein LOC143274785 n=1 Tax=Babylonia areolata TaxID=304850 RepID=UPI003FD57969